MHLCFVLLSVFLSVVHGGPYTIVSPSEWLAGSSVTITWSGPSGAEVTLRSGNMSDLASRPIGTATLDTNSITWIVPSSLVEGLYAISVCIPNSEVNDVNCSYSGLFSIVGGFSVPNGDSNTQQTIPAGYTMVRNIGLVILFAAMILALC
jgi:hypothetical protein